MHRRTGTLLSILFMGLGQWYNRQYVKGLLFFAVGVVGWYFFIYSFSDAIQGLITLGEQPSGMVKVNGLYVSVEGDHSIFMMVEGLIALLVVLLFVYVYVLNLRDAYITGAMRDQGQKARNFSESLAYVKDKKFPLIILAPPIIVIIFITILPIIFGILLAFTNYSAPNNLPPAKLVDWVGFRNFLDLVSLTTWSGTFFGLLKWTIVWAVFATFTTYFGGVLVALLIHQEGIRFKKFWRTILIIPFAIPNLVSLLVMRNLFNGQFGPINDMLRMVGLEGVPWLTDPFWAKVTVILVNMWIGIPVSMILVAGILTTIPKDLYEAAEVDGASALQKFWKITMPRIIIATTPIIILQFAGNINNFNVIFLLTKGEPTNADYQYAGHTDLLITWLYKLALDNQRYNFSAVIGIIVFVIIASLSILAFRRSRAYKEEDINL